MGEWKSKSKKEQPSVIHGQIWHRHHWGESYRTSFLVDQCEIAILESYLLAWLSLVPYMYSSLRRDWFLNMPTWLKALLCLPRDGRGEVDLCGFWRRHSARTNTRIHGYWSYPRQASGDPYRAHVRWAAPAIPYWDQRKVVRLIFWRTERR